ncbi:MAG TPA: hypothetical protein VL048_12630, partial [Xanthobacteraceae bacterium]|nr:hypothetical protein [Xanthobacteraceae bacterium]
FDTEGRLIMKFTTDVVRAGEGGRPDVLHRTTVEEISPRRVKTKADQPFQGLTRQGGRPPRACSIHAAKSRTAQPETLGSG